MAAYNLLNPIRTVNGAAVPVPSRYQWNEEDVSEPDAGRTEDGVMHKKQIRHCIKLNLTWNNINTTTISAILQAFEGEYLTVVYLDAKAGEYLTKTFYVGGRTAPMYNNFLGVWENLTFNLIER